MSSAKLDAFEAEYRRRQGAGPDAPDLDPGRYDWRSIARPKQLAPEGDWQKWLVQAGRGFGKMLDLDTPIPTPAGWSTMGTLRVGDRVFDEAGRPCRVTWLSDIETPAHAHRVEFADGETIDACAEHRWVTWTHRERKAFLRSPREDAREFPADWPNWRPGGPAGEHSGPRVRTTAELAATLTYGRRGDRNHCIPQAGPLVLPAADLPIPPHALGLRLGVDGGELPAIYLRASAAQRLDLLRGLMDGGGTVGATRAASFLAPDPRLADAVYELVVSLGMRATRDRGPATRAGVPPGAPHRVTFTPTIQVFTLPRRADLIRFDAKQALRRRHRMIVAAAPIPARPMRCIAVDSPNRMYLCGLGMIPTHNTKTGAEWVRELAESGDYPRIALVGPTAGDARDVMVEGESGILACCPPWNRPTYEPSKRRVTWPNRTIATLYSAEEAERLRGPQHFAAWCLTGETLVTLADGSNRRLDQVRPGDLVATRSGPRPVLARSLTRRDAALCRLGTECGRSIAGTADHPVWVEGVGFTPLAEVTPGMRACVLEPSGIAARTIVSVEGLRRRADVYDIAVEGAREFFAGGILVHNCDELRAWKKADAAWTMLMFGLRLGTNPRVLITTTPRPMALLKQIKAQPGTVAVYGSTYENEANLAPAYFATVIKPYEGTRLGRQEIEAQDLEDIPGALWQQDAIDANRLDTFPAGLRLARLAIGVDPSGKNYDPSVAKRDADPGSECGIVAAGVGEDGHGYVFQDASLTASPGGWARVVSECYHAWGAGVIVAERNFGGAMVEHTIRSVDPSANIKMVNASVGKQARAEPISALYERGLVHHVGPARDYARLEAQMTTFVPGEPSPDRMDALVWALTELMGAEVAAPPQVGGRRAGWDFAWR